MASVRCLNKPDLQFDFFGQATYRQFLLKYFSFPTLNNFPTKINRSFFLFKDLNCLQKTTDTLHFNDMFSDDQKSSVFILFFAHRILTFQKKKLLNSFNFCNFLTLFCVVFSNSSSKCV